MYLQMFVHFVQVWVGPGLHSVWVLNLPPRLLAWENWLPAAIKTKNNQDTRTYQQIKTISHSYKPTMFSALSCVR